MQKENLNFGQALELLKKEELVCRAGWNGKGMFIFQRPEDNILVTLIPNIKSLPEKVKAFLCIHQYNKEIFDEDQKPIKIKFTPYLCMKAADGTIVNGWLASQTDMQANDWQLVEF